MMETEKNKVDVGYGKSVSTTWRRREAKRRGLAIRGRTTVVFGLKSQIVGKVEGKSMVREMNALNKRFKNT